MRIFAFSLLLMITVACGSSAPASTPPAPVATTVPTAADPATPAPARQVGDCKECGAGEACVEAVTMQGPKRTCAPIAAACAAGAASCECMASACPEPYNTCNMSGAVVTCSCPSC